MVLTIAAIELPMSHAADKAVRPCVDRTHAEPQMAMQ